MRLGGLVPDRSTSFLANRGNVTDRLEAGGLKCSKSSVSGDRWESRWQALSMRCRDEGEHEIDPSEPSLGTTMGYILAKAWPKNSVCDAIMEPLTTLLPE